MRHYLSVSVKPDGKDDKKLRPTFDRYLPADAANYDDWNELFQDPGLRLTLPGKQNGQEIVVSCSFGTFSMLFLS